MIPGAGRARQEISPLAIQENLWSISRQTSIAKERKRAYTPSPHLPPFLKVSQVEMEACDCEGRLPPLFWTLNFELGTLSFDDTL